MVSRLMEPSNCQRGFGTVAGRGVNRKVAVDFLWSVTVRDVSPVWVDIELIDGLADRRDAGEPPRNDTSPVVARSRIRYEGTPFVAGGAGPQVRVRYGGTMQLCGLHAVQIGERRLEGAV